MKMIALMVVLVSSNVYASDKMNDEILCSPVSGQGIYVAVQTNPTAWVKRISIRISPTQADEIGNYTVPLSQPTVSTPGFIGSARAAYYQAEGLELSMAVADAKGQNPLGEGHLAASLPNLLKPIDTDLHCKRM